MSTSRGRARLGILVPFTNSNLEPDMAMMRPDGVSLHVARMGGYDADEIPDENQMQMLGQSDLEEPLRLLTGVKPDIVIYGCTSATLTHGPGFDQALAARIATACAAQTVTAAGALVAALRFLGAKRIGFASPYVPAINDLALGFLAELGFTAVSRSEMQEPLDNEGQGGLLPEQVFDLAMAANHADADALVLSCTDMRSLEVLAQVEAETGKPAISSNQAIMFQALRLLGIDTPLTGFGQILERSRL